MLSNSFKSFIFRIGRKGSDPDDNDEVKLHKTLLLAFSGIMAALAIIWRSIYFYFGELLAGSIPMSYAIISTVSLAIFWQVKNYTLFRIS